ncbi:unnamed protein product [Penicillium crustosum]
MASTSYYEFNNGTQIGNNHDTTTTQCHLSKRPKTSHNDGLPASRHDRYTIAWICALYIEMAAAQAMLDESHEILPTHADDRNTYVLGDIYRHNVVIACLPDGQYGTNNAAIVMMNMKRTFPAIRACLMVGIGGGVPSKADVRLGDIVVGTRVMQCDLGKVLRDGQLQRTAIPRIPHQLLGTAVSCLRSKHELSPSRVISILQQKLEGQPSYSRPISPDRLFHATYDHESLTGSCDKCDHSKLVPRSRRMLAEVRIHYGAIASGNQVMRDGTTRDNIARQLDVICFEMESAGLMDILPCLPIRGKCDYADSHKSKEWQRYAAATAAAYARELLEVLPVTGSHTSIVSTTDSYQYLSHEHRQRLLNSLKFEQMDSRKTTIQQEQKKTCRWFLSHPYYKTWLDPASLSHHHGFLWISGKPGAGKSTIMKFAYSSMKGKGRHKHTITASFFFNARGSGLEKSISGMYRSLLLQLLEGYPDLQVVLDDSELVPKTQNGPPSLNILKDLFANAVCALGQRSFTCFVDALDECDEQQVVDMVQYFEELAERSTAKGVPFRACFSSRHYPYIFIHRGLRLTLEDQPGHAEDLATYVTSRLRIKEPKLVEELQPQLISKAAGVFMWVVLVVDILNKEYRHGGMALRIRLAEIPSDLSKLFKDILRRDNENTEALLLCVLWILYAKDPLRPQEFYYALWSGLCLKSLVDSRIPDVTVLGTGAGDDTVSRYVISSSKGLAEITRSNQPRVQFIHESVRDFLIKDKGLYELWPEFGFDYESIGHEKLKQCCSLYANHILICTSVSKLLSESNSNDRKEISNDYPFLKYASENTLYHANAAAKAIPQEAFLASFPISNWINTNNVFEKFNNRKYTMSASLFYILADKGYPELIRARLKADSEIHILGERYKFPLFAALANGHRDAVAALLNTSSRFSDGIDITEGLNHRKDLKEYEDRTPLSWASQGGRARIVELLLQSRPSGDEMDRGGRTPISRASENGHEAVVRLLIDNGANVNAGDKNGWTPLQRASSNGHEAVARLLIEEEANVNASDKEGRTPLQRASSNGHEAVARLLIEEEANVNASDKEGRTPLQRASSNGHEAVARLLIEEEANINAGDKNGWTPLQRASSNGHEAVARLLIKKGANVNASDEYGRGSLSFTSSNGHEAVVRLLIDNGANVNASDKEGRTPLSYTSENGHEAVARLLIKKGVNVNASDKEGRTPLQRASSNGHEAVARLLIEEEANVNASDKEGRTPLQRASSNGHEAVARLLIEEEANVNASDKEGRTPLHRASSKGHEAVARLLIEKEADVNASDKEGLTPLQGALKNGYEAMLVLLNPPDKSSSNGHEVVTRLLIDKGADINTSDNRGWTPLHWASSKGREAVTRFLIKEGANVNASDEYGRGSLSFASLNDHEAVVRLLIDDGANVNASDKDGRTPLSHVSSNGYEVVARLLIEKGANVNTSDKEGRTPLHRALSKGHEAVARLLIEKGANVNTSDKEGRTPLQRASSNDHEAMARLLVDDGAQLERRTSKQTSILHFLILLASYSPLLSSSISLERKIYS